MTDDLRSVGVEEELLLLDRDGRTTTPAGPAIVRAASAPGRVMAELKQDQVEIASAPCTSMGDLAHELLTLRRRVSDLAAGHGARVLAVGTAPCVATPTPTVGDRYDRIAAVFTDLATNQLTCGTHVHVAVRSRDEGVAVLDRIRPWLCVLNALTANSPFWQGRDTGYASYRAVVLSQLPTAGPTPVWGDVGAYDRALGQLLATGAAFDPAMIYYDARLSATYPTVEVRVADACATVQEAVALAALCRALVTSAVGWWSAGRPAPDVPVGVLRGAAWRAARYGMTDCLYHPELKGLAPAWQVVDDLVFRVADELAATGDLEQVCSSLALLRVRGTGAELQRGGRFPALDEQPSAWSAARDAAVR